VAEEIDLARQQLEEALRKYNERVAAYSAGLEGWASGSSIALWDALVTTRAEVDAAKNDLEEKTKALKALVDEE